MKKLFFSAVLLLTAAAYAQTVTDCSQVVPNGEDIYNGTFLGARPIKGQLPIYK